ncbi:MAG: hypothetical protein H6882_02425 [Rhodobiaceae bacterium]|nr:hypothetical protein [Rhodobiaceae bacterium]
MQQRIVSSRLPHLLAPHAQVVGIAPTMAVKAHQRMCRKAGLRRLPDIFTGRGTHAEGVDNVEAVAKCWKPGRFEGVAPIQPFGDFSSNAACRYPPANEQGSTGFSLIHAVRRPALCY